MVNIFMDIVFDKWFQRNYPKLQFEHNADDIVVYCCHHRQALDVLEAIGKRMGACLELPGEDPGGVLSSQPKEAAQRYPLKALTFWATPLKRSEDQILDFRNN